MINELLQLAWDALLFRHDAYARHVARADALKRGLLLLVLVTLLAGLISFVVNVVGDLGPQDLADEQRETEEGFREFFRNFTSLSPYLDLPPGFDEEQMMAYMRPGLDIGFRIAALPTPLPKPLGWLLQDVGALLSLPFARLAGWFGYAVWVILVAKLLGGRATIAQTLGATALYAVPHVLDILGLVPCLGGILGLAATVWGIAIYVKALSVANEFTIGRAVAATVVPAVAFVGLSVLGFLVILVLGLTAG